MAYQFITNIQPKEHDAFVSSHTLCNLLQSSNWAKVKDNWDHILVGVKEDENLVASALVLIKHLPLSFTILYIPRGPIFDYENEKLAAFFMSQLKHLGNQYHALNIIMDPAIHCNDFTFADKNENRYPESLKIVHILRNLGIQHKGFTTSLDATVQPRYHANVYNHEHFYDELPKRTKKALATMEKKMVSVCPYGKEAVPAFASVMRCTEERKKIALRGEDYFLKLMETYGDDAVIYLAKLPLKKIYEDFSHKLKENTEAISTCPDNAKKKMFTLREQKASYEREVRDLKELIEKHGDEVVIAGALCVKFGKSAELLYAGMDDTYKRYMAPYATFYNCMKWSFEHGCESCNMGGIEGDLQGGLSTFKESFTPIINEYIGEFDMPVNKPFYALSKIAMSMRKKLRHH